MKSDRPKRGSFIGGTGAIPRRSRRGYAPSQRQFPNVFVPKQRICQCRSTGYDPSVPERPKTGGSSVRPHWKQGVPQCGNQTTSTGRILAEKVTPSPSKFVGLPVAKTTLGVRTRQRIGVPGAWHSQETAYRPVTHRFQRCVGLVVCKPEIPNPAVRCRGIPPRSRGGGCQKRRTAVCQMLPVTQNDGRCRLASSC